MSYLIHLFILTGVTALLVKWKFFHSKKRFYTYTVFFLVNFTIRLLLIYFNEELNFFADKLAGNLSIEIHKSYQLYGLSGVLTNSGNFLLQYLINLLFFQLNGGTRATLLINNAYIGSVIPLFMAYGLKKYYGAKYEIYILFLFSFFPCFINFSIFGLRDVIILAIVSLNVISVIYMYASKSNTSQLYKALLLYVLSNGLMLLIRPEMIVILGFPAVVYGISQVLNFISRINEKHTRVLAGFMSFLFLIVFTFYLANSAKDYLTSNIGVTSEVTAMEVVNEYAEQRYERQFKGDGGGSAIIESNSYHNLGTWSRLSLQTLGMLVIPFPWQINSITKLLAFLDTILVMFLLYHLARFYYLQFRRKNFGMNKFLKNPHNILGMTFLFSVLLYGLLVINFGNAFRLRMSILPYLIVPATYFLIYKKSLG